ncbi:hypothetical protein K8T06_03495 [bacterium]|nr:hypothetical protein [bacterium]
MDLNRTEKEERSHKIYNYQTIENQFELSGYLFEKVPDYSLTVEKFSYCPARTKQNGRAGEATPTEWVQEDEMPRQHIHTFNACWINPEPEPQAKIYQQGLLISDICLLLSLWGNQNIITSTMLTHESPYFTGSSLFHPVGMIEHRLSVERAISNLVDHSDAKEKRILPSLFLLWKARKVRDFHSKSIFISVVLDIVSSNQKPFNWSKEQKIDIKERKEKLTSALGEIKDSNQLHCNAYKPFKNSINSLGSPKAADKLFAFLKNTPATKNLKLNDKVYESHARIYNKIRNAIIHRADIPKKENMEILFGNRTPVVFSKNCDLEKLTRVVIYYNRIFEDLLQLHFSVYSMLTPQK